VADDDELPERRLNPILLALLGGVAILLGVVWYFSSNRSPDQDKLINPQLHSEQAEPTALCSDSETYRIIKNQLFTRAAQIRGSDQAMFAKVAGVAVLLMENAVMEGEDSAKRTVNCSGNLSLDLPPGLTVFGGARTLTADVDYTILLPGDAAVMNVEAHGTDAIVTALATLAEAAPTDAAAPDGNAVAPGGNAAAAESAAKPVGPANAAAVRPSFDCANARTAGESAVCADSGLAALDVNMAAEYRRALASAGPAQRQQLQSSRDRFLAYRDRCPTRQCMADAYVGRMREIRDIMEGRLTRNR